MISNQSREAAPEPREEFTGFMQELFSLDSGQLSKLLDKKCYHLTFKNQDDTIPGEHKSELLTLYYNPHKTQIILNRSTKKHKNLRPLLVDNIDWTEPIENDFFNPNLGSYGDL
jgi:hypothetical protein